MSDRHPFIYNEFDIEAARKAGQSDEQERIIKLLENELPQFTEKNPGQPVEAEAWGLRWAIELIKRETK